MKHITHITKHGTRSAERKTHEDARSTIQDARSKIRGTHIPVLLHEAVNALNIRKGFSYVDGTAGQGGHADEIIKDMVRVNGFIRQNSKGISGGRGSKTVLHLIDKDKEAINGLRKRFRNCTFCRFHVGSFGQLDEVISGEKNRKGGILLDLGISSAQIEDPARGFSFKRSGPLDMRIGDTKLTAAEIVNEGDEDTLIKILRIYGEERFAVRIAKKIISARKQVPIISTFQLAEIVSSAIPKKFQRHIHPATKTFMALRIAVNDELEELEKGLSSAVNALAAGGRLAVISFHSLEDAIVKKFFKNMAEECVCPPKLPKCVCGVKLRAIILTKKPIIPSEEEIKNNARARSAKLRILEKR